MVRSRAELHGRSGAGPPAPTALILFMSRDVQTGSDRKCLSVVVPAYDEGATLRRIVSKLTAVPNLLEIIIVDDCSSDDTPMIASELAEELEFVRYVRHEKNLGKTAALRTGFALTTGEVVIVQDADLEYDPAEIPEVIRPIVDGFADVVYGSRFMVKR